jgi:hypothetical protein
MTGGEVKIKQKTLLSSDDYQKTLRFMTEMPNEWEEMSR